MNLLSHSNEPGNQWPSCCSGLPVVDKAHKRRLGGGGGAIFQRCAINMFGVRSGWQPANSELSGMTSSLHWLWSAHTPVYNLHIILHVWTRWYLKHVVCTSHPSFVCMQCVPHTLHIPPIETPSALALINPFWTCLWLTKRLVLPPNFVQEGCCIGSHDSPYKISTANTTAHTVGATLDECAATLNKRAWSVVLYSA